MPTAVADAIFFAGATGVIAVIGVVRLGQAVTVRKVALALIIIGVGVLRLGAGHG